ncbi:MAG: hypothetical protein A3F72_07730 [Bacteroidetes bacterium RIFCSPLOWO2_12_FULL_35_15]|nr:MAG: hypothetical protein A3F72_07730 [Bacteroidetes bacterium RIFCSPLOWO2_12_FULL_35_15]
MKFFEVEGVSKRLLSGIFILKIFFGLLLWAIYTFYYTDRSTADIYKYFDDSKVLSDILKTNPTHYFKILFGIGNNAPEFETYYAQMHFWARKIDSNIYNDSHTIIRFNSLVRFFSFGYYNVHTVFICFLSLLGLTGIYKTFVVYLQDKKTELLIAVFLLPSVLFWGSGVLKEGLIFFALGLLIYHFNKLFSLRSIFICLGVALLLALSKFYVWLAIVPGLLFILWINKTSSSKIILKFTLVILMFGTIGLNIDRFTSIQNPLVTLSQKQIEFNQLASGQLTDANKNPIAIAKSAIKIRTLEPTLYSFVRNSPEALINTTLRPYIWELKSPLMIMAGLENLLILGFILLCILFIKPLAEIRWEYVLFCISFVMIQFLIIGETTPIIGAIARYKVPALPFLLIAFLFMLDKNKLIKRIPLLKKLLR